MDSHPQFPLSLYFQKKRHLGEKKKEEEEENISSSDLTTQERLIFFASKKQNILFKVCAFCCSVSGVVISVSRFFFFKMLWRGLGMLAPSTGKQLIVASFWPGATVGEHF